MRGRDLILQHEGFIAEVSYEDGDEAMHGSTVNTRTVLHFAGKTVAELKEAFASTIDDYRAWCEERGVELDKFYSGTLFGVPCRGSSDASSEDTSTLTPYLATR